MEWYPESKVYFDGSHYVAIPHTERPKYKRRKPREEVITVKANDITALPPSAYSVADNNNLNNEIISKYNLKELSEEEVQSCPFEIRETTTTPKNIPQPNGNLRKITKKQLFEELHQKHIDAKKAKRKQLIIEEMLPYFKTKDGATRFVESNFERKERNLICRRTRMTRKANLQNFNYFVTFTYDNKLHTEESFKKDLRTTLRNLCYRKQWKYMGVWERSPEKKRLHFHGMFYIPDGTMPGQLFTKTDYNLNSHKMQEITENSYFLQRFGRNDFDAITSKSKLGDSLAYLMKYISKTGEKIVYSKGLPQYFISDIMNDDVACLMNEADGEFSKLVLFDDFRCWDEGVLVGKVSDGTIQKLRKCN
jgi:hypothetical protein